MSTSPLGAAASPLTNPSAPGDLEARSIPGGRVSVSGHASYHGVRVDVLGVRSQGSAVDIVGPLELADVEHRRDDVQTGSTSGYVDFAALDRFWLTRTSSYDAVTPGTPTPGVSTTIDGIEVGVSDTCGTVSSDGTPQLQLLWLGDSAPASDGWTTDGCGQWTRLEGRERVASVKHVEWTAVWRDLTVQVATISGDTALVFAATGGVPEYDVPEIVHGAYLRSGWSAVVPVDQLSLRSWTSTERPLGAGSVAGNVGLVRGRTVLLARAADASAGPSGVVAQKLRGETVTEEYVVHPRTRRINAAWEWRAGVDEHDVAHVRRVSTTTTWRGETRTVVAYREPQGLVYFDTETAPIAETTPLVYTMHPVQLADLPDVEALG